MFIEALFFGGLTVGLKRYFRGLTAGPKYPVLDISRGKWNLSLFC